MCIFLSCFCIFFYQAFATTDTHRHMLYTPQIRLYYRKISTQMLRSHISLPFDYAHTHIHKCRFKPKFLYTDCDTSSTHNSPSLSPFFCFFLILCLIITQTHKHFSHTNKEFLFLSVITSFFFYHKISLFDFYSLLYFLLLSINSRKRIF